VWFQQKESVPQNRFEVVIATDNGEQRAVVGVNETVDVEASHVSGSCMCENVRLAFPMADTVTAHANISSVAKPNDELSGPEGNWEKPAFTIRVLLCIFEAGST
jgi:hypothetical protein